MAAEFLGDRLDLPGRRPARTSRPRRHERLFGALITLEELSREAPVPVLRYAQFELADTSDESARVIAERWPSRAAERSPFLRPKRVRHLGFEHLLHHSPDELPQPVGTLSKIAR